MIDRPQLIKDIIEHFVALPQFYVVGQAVSDLISGDMWEYEEPRPVDITIHARKKLFNDHGGLTEDMTAASVIPDAIVEWTGGDAEGGSVRIRPVLADGEVQTYPAVNVKFLRVDDNTLPVASNIDILRLQLWQGGIAAYRTPGLLPNGGTAGRVITGAMNKQFNIMGPLTQEEQNTVGVLVNRGWSCPPAQLEQLHGALNAMLAVPIGGVDAAGVLPDITPAPVLEPIPAMALPPVFKPMTGLTDHAFTMPKGKPQIGIPGLSRSQRAHEAEIRRVHAATEAFVAQYMTPDEKVGAAHGQDIGEYAQVYAADQDGFGGDGWA